MNCRILILAIVIVACVQPSPDSQPCHVCSDLAPFTYSCEAQVGQVVFESGVYYCNLYFGESQVCETVDTCCERVNGALGDLGVCVQVQPDVGPDEP